MKNLRVWWSRDCKLTYKKVNNVQEAIVWLNEQADADLKDKSITWHAGGLEEYNREISEYCEYYNDKGPDIKENTKKTKKYYCPICNKEITTDKKYVSDGYFGACLNCDEDFYKIELLED